MITDPKQLVEGKWYDVTLRQDFKGKLAQRTKVWSMQYLGTSYGNTLIWNLRPLSGTQTVDVRRFVSAVEGVKDRPRIPR